MLSKTNYMTVKGILKNITFLVQYEENTAAKSVRDNNCKESGEVATSYLSQ